MKKIFISICSIVVCTAHANTETIQWYVDGNLYDTTTCQSGGNIILPTAPTKRGYTFAGWQSYTPIEYIESTGGQYIDTGVSGLGSGDWEIYMKWMPLNTTITGYTAPLAAYTNDQTNTYRIIYNNGLATSFILYGNIVGGNCPYAIVNDVSIGAIHEILLGNGYAYFDNVRYNMRASCQGNALPDTTTIKINSGSQLKGRFYSLWATKDGVYMYDFIPVLDQDGTPCMYDKVSHKFFYNSGTGNFIAGPIIAE